LENMKANLSHVCQISDDSGEIYTYERMLKSAISFAQSLKELNVNKGDKILLLMDNHHYMTATWLGCVFAGAVLCPFMISEDSTREDTMELINQINPKLMLTSYFDQVEEFRGIFKELRMNCQIFTYKNQIFGCHDMKRLLERVVNIDDFKPTTIQDPAKDVFMLTLSSSTTGKAKLIMNTHMQFLLTMIGAPTGVTGATTMKPGWISEAKTIFWTLVPKNTRIIRAEFTIDNFLKMIEKYKINVLIIKPIDIFDAVKSNTINTVNLSTLRMVASTGQHLSVKLAKEFQQYIPNGMIMSSYGMSEIASGVTNGIMQKQGSVGKLNKNTEVRVVDDAGKQLGLNEVGELHVKLLAPFAGYYKNEQLTKENLTDDGYFKTGDIGYLDEECNVFLVDRKKYLISYRGEWLNQSDIEKIVFENVKGINGVCVVDVESDEHGVIPVIVIVPDKKAELNEQDIIDIVQKNSTVKFETKVFFFDKLPLTVSGKYKKYIVRDMVLKVM